MKKKYGIKLEDLIKMRDNYIKTRNEEIDKDYKEGLNGNIDRVNDAIKNGEYDK